MTKLTFDKYSNLTDKHRADVIYVLERLETEYQKILFIQLITKIYDELETMSSKIDILMNRANNTKLEVV